jgi:hypothetical protein
VARIVQELVVCDMREANKCAGKDVESWSVRAPDGNGATLDLCVDCSAVLRALIAKAAPGREIRPRTARTRVQMHQVTAIDPALLPEDMR